MKKLLYFSLFSILLLPSMALAHVKWFVEEDGHIEVPQENLTVFWIFAVIFSALIILGSVLLERYLPDFSKNTQYRLNSKKHKVASIFSMVIGLFLMLSAYQGFVFSPNVTNLGILQTPLLLLETIFGLMLFIGFGVRTVAFLMMALYPFFALYFGPLMIFENLILLGTSLFMLIYGRSHYALGRQKVFANRFFATQEEYAIPLLRVITGIDLVILGFSEKILRPDLALDFLQHFPWNFMQMAGVEWYSDLIFAMSAGVVEVLFGIIFILGTTTRINAITIGIFFTITLVLLGPLELLGHLPHFAFVAIMLMFGSGNKLKVHFSE